jgi:hypothetical protein
MVCTRHTGDLYSGYGGLYMGFGGLYMSTDAENMSFVGRAMSFGRGEISDGPWGGCLKRRYRRTL